MKAYWYVRSCRVVVIRRVIFVKQLLYVYVCSARGGHTGTRLGNARATSTLYLLYTTSRSRLFRFFLSHNDRLSPRSLPRKHLPLTDGRGRSKVRSCTSKNLNSEREATHGPV